MSAALWALWLGQDFTFLGVCFGSGADVDAAKRSAVAGHERRDSGPVQELRQAVPSHDRRVPEERTGPETGGQTASQARVLQEGQGEEYLSVLHQLSLAIPPWVGAVSTGESWDVNRHTARCISPVSVVLQCKLVSG